MWRQHRLSHVLLPNLIRVTHLESAVLPRPQVVFEQLRWVLPEGAARLMFAAVSIMGVL